MSSTDASAPTIPASTDFSHNFTRYIHADEVIVNSMTDDVATMTGGIISNLNDPTSDSDAATKSYVDANTPGGVASLPLNSIQFNDAGSFGGSTNLTFDGTTMTSLHYVIGTGSDMLTIGSDTITNLVDPTNAQDPITKQYVDNFYRMTQASISTSLASTYAATEMVNVILSRTYGTVGTIVDYTSPASDIISYMTSTSSIATATTLPFILRNVDSYDITSVIRLTENTGMTLIPTGPGYIDVFPGYELNSRLVITDNGLTSGTETMNVEILGLSYLDVNSNFLVGSRGITTTAGTTRVYDQFQFNTKQIVLTEQNVVYTPININGIVLRNYSGTKTDTFSPVSEFISGYAYIDSPIDYIFSTGAVELSIKNISTTGAITLSTTTGWTFDANSNMTIGAGQTGLFYMYIDTSAETGALYTIGIFDTTS